MPEVTRTCYRCGKILTRPLPDNADYIMAQDLIVTEDRHISKHEFVMHGVRTDTPASTITDLRGAGAKRAYIRQLIERKIGLDAEGKMMTVDIPVDKEISESDLSMINAEKVEDVFGALLPVAIQKAALICPECTLPTDTIIWGIHKKRGKPGDNILAGS